MWLKTLIRSRVLLKTSHSPPIYCYISEMVEDRWIHAARRLTSIEFSFDPFDIYRYSPRGVGYTQLTHVQLAIAILLVTFVITSMARNSLLCADVSLRNYSLTHSLTHSLTQSVNHSITQSPMQFLHFNSLTIFLFIISLLSHSPLSSCTISYCTPVIYRSITKNVHLT